MVSLLVGLLDTLRFVTGIYMFVRVAGDCLIVFVGPVDLLLLVFEIVSS